MRLHCKTVALPPLQITGKRYDSVVLRRAAPSFLPPMLLEPVPLLPDDPVAWRYELKLDGYRAIAFKSGRTLHLRSRNDNDFGLRYTAIAQALASLPANTVIDGEIVALGADGRPSFGLLQNHGSTHPDLFYYVFDVPILNGRDLQAEPLEHRLALLNEKVLPKLEEPIRPCVELAATLPDLIRSVREQRLEGLVAKKRDSPYESGKRTGLWQKMRVNQSAEFVIGGYTIGGKTFDALVLGYYENGNLRYASRTRNGFTPAIREQIMARMKPLSTTACPFSDLPEKSGGRWGQGLTAAKMKDCRWLRPELVGQFEFVEWTSDAHLRHTRFIALRDDKPAHQVIREL
jgi:DNA ligase D-like protein (predicted ligase)